MEQLAARLPGWSLFADQYAVSAYPRHLAGDLHELAEAGLAQGLDRLCDEFGRLWRRQGDSLFFRTRFWFHDRLYEAPGPVVAAVRDSLHRHGY